MKIFFEKNMAATYYPVPLLAGYSTIGAPTGGLTAPFSMGKGSRNNFGKGEKQKNPSIMKSFLKRIWQLPTLPSRYWRDAASVVRRQAD